MGGYNPIRTTDSTGYYIFDDLPPGCYVVVVTPPGGYTQTGDPDKWGVPCTTCDNRTTTPVVLAPGDVFLNADFGYQPPVNATGSIGNTVWLDLDADGVGPNGNGAAPGTDNSEPGIAGVTVALIRDLNANGSGIRRADHRHRRHRRQRPVPVHRPAGDERRRHRRLPGVGQRHQQRAGQPPADL